MFIAGRSEKYEIKFDTKKIVHEEKHEELFLDHEFMPIIDYIDKKGLALIVPTIIEGWDATWIYNKLKHVSINDAAKRLEHFLYMRLSKKRPITIEHTMKWL